MIYYTFQIEFKLQNTKLLHSNIFCSTQNDLNIKKTLSRCLAKCVKGREVDKYRTILKCIINTILNSKPYLINAIFTWSLWS
jgi:hypothetical protein